MTIADVAAHAGVSVGAVSFALNDRPGVGDATRNRIRASAAELGWSPSLPARALSRSTAYAVGLVLARSTEAVAADPFFPAFIAGVNAVLAQTQRALLVTTVDDQDAELATYRRLAAEGRVDGVFLTDLRRRDPRPALLAGLPLPAVTLGRPSRASQAPAVGSVSVDDVAGIRDVTESLVGLGHRRLAHVTGPAGYLHVHHRTGAWANAVSKAGLPADAIVNTDFSAAAGARATDELLDRSDPPTAIVYANDVMAIAGIAAAQRRGLRVPEQLSVSGFDDIALAEYTHPPLTTVHTDVEGWGRAAATALLDAIDGKPATHIRRDPAQLIGRASIGPPSR